MRVFTGPIVVDVDEHDAERVRLTMRDPAGRQMTVVLEPHEAAFIAGYLHGAAIHVHERLALAEDDG